MAGAYMVSVVAFIMLTILLLYHVYCLIDLEIYRYRLVLHMGDVEQKHINLYRKIAGLSKNKGKSLIRTGIRTVKSNIMSYIVKGITVLNLILVIITGLLSLSLYGLNNSMAAIALNNKHIVQSRRDKEDESWVDEKDDARHGISRDEAGASNSSNSDTSNNSETSNTDEGTENTDEINLTGCYVDIDGEKIDASNGWIDKKNYRLYFEDSWVDLYEYSIYKEDGSVLEVPEPDSD
jgi:hypothetical protein